MPVGRFHELKHVFDSGLRDVLPNLRAVRLTPRHTNRAVPFSRPRWRFEWMILLTHGLCPLRQAGGIAALQRVSGE
jgi:hypothetical protein